MNKNILFLAAFVLTVVMSAIYGLSRFSIAPAPVVPATIKDGSVAATDKNIIDLNDFDADLSASIQDDIVSTELNETLDEVGEINKATENLTNEKESLSNFDNELSGLSGDEAVDKEIEQILQEMSL